MLWPQADALDRRTSGTVGMRFHVEVVSFYGQYLLKVLYFGSTRNV